MNKTPVSILQEMMVKKQMTPNYELIHDGGGTHINTFTYRVSCDGLTATGTGRCKKDAKHEAAKAMLEAIAAHRAYPQLPASPAQSPVRMPLSTTVPVSPRIPANVPFVNAIGTLKALCADNNLQEPEYHQISDVGPPHERIFTIECVVATFREEAAATTKKQAKHEAAKKMLDRIKGLVDNLNSPEDLYCHIQSEESKQNEMIATEMAKARYAELCRLQSLKKINFGLKISEYHHHLRNAYSKEVREEIIEKLLSFIPDDHNNNFKEIVDDMLLKIKELLQSLTLNVSETILESSSSEDCLAVIRIDSDPVIVMIALGKTEQEAMYSAIVKLVNSMVLLLK